MGTAKRERQKANRQIRLQELAKEQRKEKSKKVAFRVVLGVLVFVALVGGVYLIGGSDDNNAASSTTTLPLPATTTTVGLCATPASTTVDATAPTTTTPPKPEVKVPGANVDALKVVGSPGTELEFAL